MNSIVSGSVKAENKKSLGRYFAAFKDGYLVGLISMDSPKDVSFESFKKSVISCLSLIGEVKYGELIDIDGAKYLSVPRGNKNTSLRVPPKLIPFKTTIVNSQER